MGVKPASSSMPSADCTAISPKPNDEIATQGLSNSKSWPCVISTMPQIAPTALTICAFSSGFILTMSSTVWCIVMSRVPTYLSM